MSVFVLDRSGKPLMPCSEKRARKLLAAGRARVHRLVPFVIRLIDRHAKSCGFQPLRIKIDPGSKATGLALVRDTETVEATVPASSKKAGRYVGRVAVRASGSFNIQAGSTVVQGVSHKHCRIIQRSDGYGYSRIAISKGDAGVGHVSRAWLSLPGLKAEVSREI